MFILTMAFYGVNGNTFLEMHPDIHQKLIGKDESVEDMTWNNLGEWQINHIIPVSSAKTEEEMIKLNHYLNLQPLWESDNIRKGNKF